MRTRSFSIQSTKAIRWILAYLLYISLGMEATEASDQIYGLHALLTNGGLDMPDPDYTRDTVSVYESTVRAWLKSCRDLTILRLAARPHFSGPIASGIEVPSWVPPWHLKPSENMSVHHIDPGFGFEDLKGTCWTPPLTYSPRKLQLRGRSSGIAQYVRPMKTLTRGHHENERLQYTANLRQVVQRLYRTQRQTDEVKLRSVLCELYYALANKPFIANPTEPQSSNYQGEQTFCDMVDVLEYPECRRLPLWYAEYIEACIQSPNLITRHSLFHQDGSLSFDLMDTYFWQLRKIKIGNKVLWNRLQRVYKQWRWGLKNDGTLSFLDNGAIASTPLWTQPGDELFLFPGADCPFVLRKANDNEYRLVGPAYMYRCRDYTKWEFDEAEMVDVTLI